MLSIVTINKDNQAGLQKTIESLKQLNGHEFQWICIDSLSSDQSMKLANDPFDETYIFAADFEHYLRINRNKLRIYRDDFSLIVNEPYGSDSHLPALLNEYRLALIKNGSPKVWAHFVYWFKTYYLKSALRKRA